MRSLAQIAAQYGADIPALLAVQQETSSDFVQRMHDNGIGDEKISKIVSEFWECRK